MNQIESIKEFGGWLNRYEHQSASCNCTMTFSVYLPPLAETEKVPVVYWLSGLSCTDDNVRTKAGAQRYAAELGLALVMPDTSPRGYDVADTKDRYDLGKGAGFYVNATEEPWSSHYQMYEYVTVELPALIKMANEIASNIAPGRSQKQAASMMTDHIVHFWAISMKLQIIECLQEENNQLEPTATQAIQSLKEIYS